MLFFQGAIFGQGSPGLPHEPDRGTIYRAAMTGIQKALAVVYFGAFLSPGCPRLTTPGSVFDSRTHQFQLCAKTGGEESTESVSDFKGNDGNYGKNGRLW